MNLHEVESAADTIARGMGRYEALLMPEQLQRGFEPYEVRLATSIGWADDEFFVKAWSRELRIHTFEQVDTEELRRFSGSVRHFVGTLKALIEPMLAEFALHQWRGTPGPSRDHMSGSAVAWLETWGENERRECEE